MRTTGPSKVLVSLAHLFISSRRKRPTCADASSQNTSGKARVRKTSFGSYVEQGVIAKVNEPTAWCSNELIRETPKKFRVYIDPSQTVNKAIHRPKLQMPTLNGQLHKLSAAKCFSLVDVKEGFLHIPLDEDSSWMTTMHTSYGRYR